MTEECFFQLCSFECMTHYHVQIEFIVQILSCDIQGSYNAPSYSQVANNNYFQYQYECINLLKPTGNVMHQQV